MKGRLRLRGLTRALALALGLLMLFSVPAHAAPGDVTINAANFPDANFRQYVRESFDTNGDGTLSASELGSVTEMNCSDMNIASLRGVEYFTALKTLYCYKNQLTSLDVSRNTALETLWCHANQITSLDIRKNTALKELICGLNPLTSLDVSKNTALIRLQIQLSQIETIDLSKNTQLKVLSCFDCQLTALDLSNLPNLIDLTCYGNQLTELDVSHNTALKELSCKTNQLTELDVSHNPALETLDCPSNELTELDVSHNPALRVLYCARNPLTELDITQNPALESLTCPDHFTFLDLSGNPALINLRCDSPYLLTLDLRGCPALQYAVENGTYSNQYHQDTYTANYNGQDVTCAVKDDVGLVTGRVPINAANFPAAEFRSYVRTNFDTNNDGYLSLAECQAPTELRLLNAGLTSLAGVEYFPNLTYLDCSGNALTELDLRGNPKLKMLFCENNGLTALDLRSCHALEKLFCYNDDLSALDLTRSPRLFDAVLDGYYLGHSTGGDQYALDGNILLADETTALLLGNDGLPISHRYFPDDNFRAYLREERDSDGDRFFSDDERAFVTSISCQNMDIAGLSGLEHFPELLALECSGNAITELDLRGNPKLGVLFCENNEIAELQLGSKPDLGMLWCYNNALSALDLSGCPEILHAVEHGAMTDHGTYVSYSSPRGTAYIDKATGITSATVLVGDVNGDGSVTNADAALLKRYVAGWSVSIDRNAADLNRDGSVTNADAALLNRYIAGWAGYDSYIIEVPASP